MTADTAPTLPPPPDPWDYAYEWDGPYGTRKLSVATHNGRKPDRTVPIYKADHLHAYATAHAAALAQRAEELERALTRLMRHFPTDTDMAEAGWSADEVEQACRAHENAAHVLKGDQHAG